MTDPTRPNRDINSLQPLAQQAARLFLDTCKQQNINIFVTEYHRSQSRQDYLYEQGRTSPGSIVTWTKTSNHTTGYAWDIAVNPPQDLYDKDILKKAGQVAQTLNIEWGGTWQTPDTPHFQINKNWTPPNKEDLPYKEAVTKLAHTLNINICSWYPAPNPKNLPALIQKIGKHQYNLSAYDQIIHKLHDDQIISQPELWLTHSYNLSHIKSLIKKIA